jgi:hypothetical protein
MFSIFTPLVAADGYSCDGVWHHLAVRISGWNETEQAGHREECFVPKPRFAPAPKFPVAIVLLNDGHLRNWHDEPTTPATDVGVLRRDLVFEVPRQDHHVIGLSFGELLRRENRNVGTR